MTCLKLNFLILFLIPTVIGSLGNASLFCHSIFVFFSGCRSRFTEVILRHLTLANSLYILCRGIPEIMKALGMEGFLNNIGCKMIFYVQVVCKGVSFSTTCLLSVSQFITISLRSSSTAAVKVRALKSIGPCSIMCWVLHMLLNIRVPMLVSDQKSHKSSTDTIDFQHCSVMSSAKGKFTIFEALILSHDILCLKLMIWSSSSMLFILYRHKQRMLHVYRHNMSSRSTAEARASQRILILVCTFVFFYALSCMFYVWFSLDNRAARWLVKTSALTNACFPTASPFILMHCEHCVCRPRWKK